MRHPSQEEGHGRRRKIIADLNCNTPRMAAPYFRSQHIITKTEAADIE
jgi:hypothetical protein